MADGARRWQPVVVDVPTLPFEPRPPSPHGYRPDTLCDGWSTADFQVRLASTRGYAHRYSGVPRQDAVDVRIHPTTEALVFAVADGVSSARLSEIGATTACSVMVETTLGALDRDPDRVDLANIARRTATEMVRRLGGDAAEVGRCFATTLVAGLVAPRPDGAAATILQIGDTGAWLFRGGRFHSLFDRKPTSTVVPSVVVALPRVPDETRPIHLRVTPDDVLLIGTDGFGDPLGDGTGLVGELFAGLLRTTPVPLELAHALDFSRETFDDDRTLVAVWPRGGAEGSP